MYAYRRRRAWAAFGVFDICACALGELLEEEGALDAELLNLAFDAGDADSGGVVGFFDLVVAALELDALSAVGLLDRGRELWWDGWVTGVSTDFGELALARHGDGGFGRSNLMMMTLKEGSRLGSANGQVYRDAVGSGKVEGRSSTVTRLTILRRHDARFTLSACAKSPCCSRKALAAPLTKGETLGGFVSRKDAAAVR